GAIGTGRISRVHDLPGIWRYDAARIMAVCDLDSNRVADAKTLINGQYAKKILKGQYEKKTGSPYGGVVVYPTYQERPPKKDAEAVVTSTPDPWHSIV